VYTSAVYLYLRSIFTAGAAGGSAFTVLLSLFISLWIMNSERFQVYVLHYNLSRDHPLDLIGIRLPWGLDPRGVIYTSAVHLYLRSILTAGTAALLVLPACPLYHLIGLRSPRDPQPHP
jgi:hypothetical protein